VISSRTTVGVVIAIVMSTLLLLLGVVAYGVAVPHAMFGLVLAVVVGAAAFACIAFAVSTQIHAADSTAPATNLTVLPLYFISGVFVPETQIPKFLRDIAEVFPIYHLANALRQPFVESHGAAISGRDLLVLAAWGIGALLVAARTFRWSPSAVG
jgi:ABC-2 type transport system permease protein